MDELEDEPKGARRDDDYGDLQDQGERCGR